MNIDFHYGVIYILSRLAGFEQQKARTIAHACQYVDDSTVTGVLEFAGGETYERFASAHGMLDYRNALESKDKLVWAPFHFLPAGVGDTLEEKSICRPNSVIAQEMVKRMIEGCHAENALHRLGITIHVYVDTWAHQGFTGTISRHNYVETLTSDDHPAGTWEARVKQKLESVADEGESHVAELASGWGKHVVLGHGAALHFPDWPFAKWQYTNGHGMSIPRDNLPQFMEAADLAYRALKGFQSGNVDYTNEPGLPDEAKAALQEFLQSNRSEDEAVRLSNLIDWVADGKIPGIREAIPAYISKGGGSWKHAATGILSMDDDGPFKPTWSKQFEDSDYRKFHDAIKEHRFVVTQEILPKHDVRLA